MYVSDEQLTALRKLYRRTILADAGASLSTVVLMILLFATGIVSPNPVGLAITVTLAAVLASAEYILERLLFKRGLNAAVVTLVCLLATLILGGLLLGASLSGLLGFFFFRPLIPLVALLRDRARLADGNPCKAIGRVKQGSRRVVSSGLEALDTVLLFEDEVTHEKHLLRAQSLSSRHRYRVYFLPHSGLSVGEIIPDEAQFDPFGNPVGTADAQDADTAGDAPSPKPSHSIDPNSPERQKAARYAAGKKICNLLTVVLFAFAFLSGIAAQEGDGTSIPLLFLPLLVACILLGTFCKNQELKLRCTHRTTAICVDTVRRRSGKSSHRHPVVEFEVDGTTYTAELSVACSRDVVGQLYTIEYDPLEPSVVRGGWQDES